MFGILLQAVKPILVLRARRERQSSNKPFVLRYNLKFATLPVHGKNGFVTATKLGTTNKLFVVATKNFAAATKRFVNRTKHCVFVTKYFCYPYFNK